MIARAGEIAALGTAVSWTFTALFFEAAGLRIGSLVVNLVRLVMALGYFIPVMLWLHGEPLALHAPAAAWGWLALSALFGFLLCDGCLFRAFLVVGSRRTITIMALVPPITALGGWLLMGERLRLADWAGMAATVTGVVLVVLDRRERTGPLPGRTLAVGAALGVLAAFGQAVGLLFSKKGMLAGLDPVAATQIRVLVGMVLFAVLFCFIGWWPKVRTGLRDPRGLALTAGGAFFGPFLGVSLSLAAVRYTEAGVAATVMALTPVLMIPAVVFLKGDRVHARGIAGAVLAVCGTALIFLG